MKPAADKPACVPVDMSHAEYAALEAVAALARGDFPSARINFAHAIHLAMTKQELDDDESVDLFGRLTEGCW